MRPEHQNSHGARAGRQSGFTLLELLVAMLAAAVLALTAAVMLVYAYRAWQANGDAVLAQQEGTLAVDMLSRSLREAAAVDVVILPGRVNIGPASFYAIGADLVYDPETGAGGDEMTVIDGRLTAFAVSTLPAGGAAIEFQFKDEENVTKVAAVAAFRN